MIDLVDLIAGHGLDAPQLRILDIGAMSLGAEPWDQLVDRGHAELLGFEPQAAECGRCNAAARPHRRYLPLALGDGATWPFHICCGAATSSVFAPHTDVIERFSGLVELMAVERIETVATTRLDDIPEAAGADFLKLDVQGFELVVLEHALRTLETSLLLQVEVSFVDLYEGQPLFADIEPFLRAHGFALHTFTGVGSRAFRPLQVDGNPFQGVRQALWTDAVFMVDPGRWRRLENTALLKLALLAHSLYGSFDLAARALALHDERTGHQLHEAYLGALSAAHAPTLFAAA